jgi:hypothetical protein
VQGGKSTSVVESAKEKRKLGRGAGDAGQGARARTSREARGGRENAGARRRAVAEPVRAVRVGHRRANVM